MALPAHEAYGERRETRDTGRSVFSGGAVPWLQRLVDYRLAGPFARWHDRSELVAPDFRIFSDKKLRRRREMAMTVPLPWGGPVQARAVVCGSERLPDGAPARFAIALRVLWVENEDEDVAFARLARFLHV